LLCFECFEKERRSGVAGTDEATFPLYFLLSTKVVRVRMSINPGVFICKGSTPLEYQHIHILK
jgi:hypothetical protein